MVGMKRIIALGATPVLALTLLAAPATAAPGEKVTKQNFPTAQQAASVFGSLKGSVREVDRVTGLTMAFTCQNDTLYSGRGFSAGYTTAAEDQSLIPILHVTESKTRAGARRAVTRFANEKKKCHRKKPLNAPVTKISLPRLGDQRTGYATTVKADDGSIAHVRVYVFRTKKRIIHVTLLSDTKVAAARGKRFARLAYRAGVK